MKLPRGATGFWHVSENRPGDVDAPKWSFDEPFRLLGKDVLDTPLEEADKSQLHETERKQIAYWRPATIGEVIFNWWD